MPNFPYFAAPSAPPPDPDPEHEHEHEQEQEQKKEELIPVDDNADNDDSACVICWKYQKTHIFWPCAHKCVCAECAAEVIKEKIPCPVCRGGIIGSKKVHE